jgi:hypothetical protein
MALDLSVKFSILNEFYVMDSSALLAGRQALTTKFHLTPSPLTGEGKGEGDSLALFPPHLNPLRPGERRSFSEQPRIQDSKDDRVLSFVHWAFESV